MELNDKIKNALIKIDFVKRYEELSNIYSDEKTSKNERLIYIDGEEIMEMIQNLGYSPLFYKKGKFYKIQEEKILDYSFGFHIILVNGMVDLVWVVRKDGELLLGAPWSVYSRRLIDVNYRIKKPIIGNYEDIEDIFKVIFKMFEDFKKAIVEDYVG